jgi:2-phospho-L-lactate guanylyltransferase (CobY/MobA/RfbA family)
MGAVTVIGDVPESDDYTRLPDSGGFVENVFAGVSAYADAPYVLIATSDLPFLTGEAVADFALQAEAKARETGAGFIWPVVPVASCYRQFPGVRRTALRLREGEYTGGNLALVRPDFLLTQRQRIADGYAARKSVVRLASMIGWGTLLRLILSQKLSPNLLSIPMLEARVSRLLGSPARALVCDYPELATDIDRPSDFAAVGLRQETSAL